MAYKEQAQSITLLAGADFRTTGRYRQAKIGSDGKVELCAAGERAAGVIMDNPNEDQAVRLGIGGVVMVELGATLNPGTLVSASTAGVVIAQTSTHAVNGILLQGGESGDVVAMLFQPQGAP